MIISKTPFRVSFFGGGSDYPDYFTSFGGSVLATTIDKYCYISCRHLPPFFEHKYRIVYSKIEDVKAIGEITHPAVRGVLKYINWKDGIEIHHDGDLPARSGLGSSSSFTVGLLNVLNATRGKFTSKSELAELAIDIEQNFLQEPVGSQDQICASYGGLNRINFSTDSSFDVSPVILNLERKKKLQEKLLLFFTGVQRFSSPIAKQKIENVKENLKTLKLMKEMVDEGVSILGNNATPLDDFGKLLNEGWNYKRSLATSVSNPQIDEMYQAGLSAGAVGGKLLGAGGGGFMLFYADKKHHKNIIAKLNRYVYIPFEFENLGSNICVYQPDNINDK